MVEELLEYNTARSPINGGFSEQALCLDDYNYFVQGDHLYQDTSAIMYIYFEKCDNTTSDVQCESEAEVNKFLKNMKLYVQID